MNKGFISLIILIIIGLALLKYFMNWDVFNAAASDQGINTIRYTRDVINYVWNIIETPVKFAWNQVAWPILSLAWDSLQAFIEWGKGNAVDLNSSAQ